MAWMACLNGKQIIAVSLETAMQNVGIAVLVLHLIARSSIASWTTVLIYDPQRCRLMAPNLILDLEVIKMAFEGP